MAKAAILLALLITLRVVSVASAYEFRVGGPRGWIKPTGEESETYNHWAGRNRFHIADSLYFKYSNDSVLVVDREDYVQCNTSNPFITYTDGNTTFWFDRYGYFYFISGEPDHCNSGQKLIVRVMVHPFVNLGPGAAPSPMPGGGGGDSGSDTGSGSGSGSGPLKAGAPWPSGVSAAFKVAAGSYSVLAGLGLGIVAILFV